jgi:glycosyltransferase involved in cell wall biosynthesis
MKILMLTSYFPPEIGSAAHLFADLGRAFAKTGDSVVVVTGFPTYNVDRKILPPKYKKGLWMRESVDGMEVIRVRTFGMPRHVPVLRGMEQLTSAFAFTFAGMFILNQKPDVILVYSPPLFLGLAAHVLRRYRKGRIVINVQDLFPQSAIDLGILRSRFLIGLFRRVESFIYRRSDLVTVHSSGNKTHVLLAGGRDDRTLVVPNVVDTDSIRPGPRVNGFRKEVGLSRSMFVVSFAGVLGYSQDVDTIIECAASFKDEKNIVFLIVGDGVEKARMIEKAMNLRNVRFLPMLTKEEYPSLLHASDVCLVTLRKQVATPVVPSKILSIMAAGRPMVAALPPQSDAVAMIKETESGLCVSAEDPVAMAEAIRELHDHPRKAAKLGRNGRRHVETVASLGACVTTYRGLFQSILRNSGSERTQ